MAPNWFDGFEARRFETEGASVYARFGGNAAGPTLVLLHGFPEMHVMWHRVVADAAGPVLRRGARSPWVRRFVETRRRGGPRQLQQADDGERRRRRGRRARARLVLLVRARPRRARRAPTRARSSVPGRQALCHRHRTDARHVRRDRPGLRHGVLPLVSSDPAESGAGVHDRRQRAGVPARRARRPGESRTRPRRAAGAGRVRTVLHARNDSRNVRGLPRERGHRSAARSREPCARRR